MTEPSPSFKVFYDHYPVDVTVDSGATSSLVKHSFAVKSKMPIFGTIHTANQADGKTKMQPCGEIHVTLSRGNMTLNLEAVVVKDLDCDILAGMPFLKSNHIVLDAPNDRLIIKDENIIEYGNRHKHSPKSVQVRRSYLLRADTKKVILPGEFIEVEAPAEISGDTEVSVEPRSDSCVKNWPVPDITNIVNGMIRIPNTTNEPVLINKHQHIAQVRLVQEYTPTICEEFPDTRHVARTSNIDGPHSGCVSIDPDGQLSVSEKRAFNDLHQSYDIVFDSSIGKYNDASGKLRASINMGPTEPPTQKGRLPLYNKNNFIELQDKMDELEMQGVLAKPEDIGVTVEHVSPSFLVKKPSGGSRLVTSFTSIGNYAKHPPSRVTKPDDVLLFLARWKYIIKSDMTSQFFQLPMKRSSIKYLGIITPFKGIRVYTRAAMGMPGSTEHLDELMYRVLGEMMYEGIVMKIADDIYVGGDTVSSLLQNWERVLHQFWKNNLRLSPTKTVVCPRNTTVLGWIWSAGDISVSPHKINPLALADPPKTVKGLRSWIGAYKHIKACILGYSVLLSDLEAAVAGKDSHEKVVWTESLITTFKKAQQTVQNPRTITIPQPSDNLVITNDGAVGNTGVGAVLHIIRDNKTYLGGYFSAKLKPHQGKWLPCEVEALAIGSAVNHWGPYILESKHQTQVLSDSKPCIQAFGKLSRGEFSTSARITTFLSTLSRYNVKLQHIAGCKNITADYLSRNPMECSNHDCQVCMFIAENEEATIRSVTVTDILEGKTSMPFMNSTTWKTTQQDCPSLRRTFSHLSQGTRPTKKMTKIKDVKRYLRVATIGNEGILVVKHRDPFTQTRNLIVVPRHVLPGLLTALHLRLQHPSKTQLHRLFQRYFFALDSDHEIDLTSSSCAHCAALAQLPKEITDFSTSYPSNIPGSFFACDVMCRARQKVLVMRETLTSFTSAKIIPNEQKDSLKSAIVETTADLKSASGCVIRADGAVAFQSLSKDSSLAKHGITIEIGRLKNRNKNPIAEKAIQELELELKKQHPEGGPVSTSQLATVVATLNSRVRTRGLSSKEMLFQRDNMTGEQLNLLDTNLAKEQYNQRSQNHTPSAKSQAPKGKKASRYAVSLGDLVYLKCDGDKHTARDRYIVTSCESEFLIVKKLAGPQFRSKDYKLKYNEIYPVPCASLSQKHNISDTTRTSAYDTESSDNSTSLEADESELSDTNSLEDDSPDLVPRQLPQPSPIPRRSSRIRRPPDWFSSKT